MNTKEFVEAILSADKETIKAVCQLLEVDPQLVLSWDQHFCKAHKAS